MSPRRYLVTSADSGRNYSVTADTWIQAKDIMSARGLKVSNVWLDPDQTELREYDDFARGDQ